MQSLCILSLRLPTDLYSSTGGRSSFAEEGAPDTVPWTLDAALAGPVGDTTCFEYRARKMRVCSPDTIPDLDAALKMATPRFAYAAAGGGVQTSSPLLARGRTPGTLEHSGGRSILAEEDAADTIPDLAALKMATPRFAYAAAGRGVPDFE